MGHIGSYGKARIAAVQYIWWPHLPLTGHLNQDWSVSGQAGPKLIIPPLLRRASSR